MSSRYRSAALTLVALLAGCSLARQTIAAGRKPPYQPVAAATVWPAPGGNLADCNPTGPVGDAPVPRGPADTIKVQSKTVRKVFAALCSFSVPVPKTNTGELQDPHH